MSIKKRFDNVLGEEYDLLKLAYPHYDQLELSASEVITAHFADSDLLTIRTLEIGCGSGITTKFLLECDQRLHVVAIDNEPKMLKAFRENLVKWEAEDRVICGSGGRVQVCQG